MRSFKKETRYVSVLTVRASGHGLIDMMRYDRCCPATEEDAHKINRIMTDSDIEGDCLVRLIRYSANNLPATRDRWASYACEVLDERSPDDEPLSDEQLARPVQR
jgi:hypothetical protein